MAIVCSICGKKQNGFIQDFPLSDNDINVRICSNCNEEKEHLFYNASNDLGVYKINKSYFETYLSNISNEEIKSAIKIMLNETDQLSQKYNYQLNQQRIQNEKLIEEDKRRKELFEHHMVTTGYNFEGHNIIKYNGIISGEVAMGTGFISDITASFSDFFGVESDKYAAKIETAKQIAIEKLINKSMYKGDNGIIGIDFDIITFSHNMIGISANGTSVKVEKVG